ncbi:polymorphic toxin type 50 domain-containing protein [Enterococcus sp.]
MTKRGEFTNKFVIHYSKNGTHIVPTLKGEDRK